MPEVKAARRGGAEATEGCGGVAGSAAGAAAHIFVSFAAPTMEFFAPGPTLTDFGPASVPCRVGRSHTRTLAHLAVQRCGLVYVVRKVGGRR